MARPWRVRYEGAKYHLTVRGNARQRVFVVEEDYVRFVDQLAEALEMDEVILYAYVLMPNHFHLLVETPRGNVQRFMQRLNTAYAMYYRFRHQKPGHCFQGRYGARLVKGNDYLLRLTRYIHLNPVKVQALADAGMAEWRKVVEQYRWSSYRGYAGLGPKEDHVDYRWLKLMGRLTERGSRKAYREYLGGLLGDKTDELIAAAKKQSDYAIGDEKFLEEASEDLKAARMSRVMTGDIAWPVETGKEPEKVLGVVLDALGLTRADLTRHGLAAGDVKMLAVEVMCRHSAATQRQVARMLGYGSESAVGKQRQKFRVRARDEAALLRRYEQLEQKVLSSAF